MERKKEKVSVAAVTKRMDFSQRGYVDVIILNVFVEYFCLILRK